MPFVHNTGRTKAEAREAADPDHSLEGLGGGEGMDVIRNFVIKVPTGYNWSKAAKIITFSRFKRE